MTLPKKKSRAITIDGEPYRWMVRATENELVLTVAHDGGGQLLQSTLNKLNLFKEGMAGEWNFVRQGRNVTPSLVRTLVETAISQGWNSKATNSKPFTLHALVWRDESRIDPVQSIGLDNWLDPPLRERAASNGLVTMAQLAQQETEWMIHDLAWPCEYRNKVLNLPPGESLPIPTEWISPAARDAGLTFRATFKGVLEESDRPAFVISSDQLNAQASFELMWW